MTILASASAASIAAPAFSLSPQRPIITHGVQSGDVSVDSGMVWARADRPARMLIEAATDSFKDICHASFVDALPETDFTAKALIEDLPPGQDIFYRLRFQDLWSPQAVSDAVIGRFRTASTDRRSISFVWSGDTAGQGWGIDPSRGGMRTYRTMLHSRPDFFVHCGDSIYADCTVPTQQTLPNGETWRNIVTEEKSNVATSLNDYRGNYKYNLLDENLRDFNAEVPIFAQWDNHEVMEDWWPGEAFDRRGYNTKSALLLAARGCRAFHEFMPLRYSPAEPGRIYRKISYGPLLDLFVLDMRSYRGPNEHPTTEYGPDAHLFGPVQLSWLKRELKRSLATWKVIASDTPLGTIADNAPDASAHLAAALKSPTCCRSCTKRLFAIQYGSLLICTIQPHIISIRITQCSRTSSHFGNSFPVLFTPGPGRHALLNGPSARQSFFKAQQAVSKVTTSPRASACSSLPTWQSTAQPRR